MINESQYGKPETLFERRKFVRINGTYVVSYEDISGQGIGADITQTRNISAGGVWFTTEKRFPAASILKIKLRIPDAPDYMELNVKVVESKQKIKGMMCDTRVKFIDIKEKERYYITKLIEDCLQYRKGIGKNGGR
jgi:hypothetical protein